VNTVSIAVVPDCRWDSYLQNDAVNDFVGELGIQGVGFGGPKTHGRAVVGRARLLYRGSEIPLQQSPMARVGHDGMKIPLQTYAWGGKKKRPPRKIKNSARFPLVYMANEGVPSFSESWLLPVHKTGYTMGILDLMTAAALDSPAVCQLPRPVLKQAPGRNPAV